MKKICLFLLLGMLTIAVNSQNQVNFTLSKTCHYVVPNSDKDYYIFNYEGESQSSLYNKALIGLTKTFVSAKDVVSKVENSMISINTTKVISYIIGGILPTKTYMDYVVEIEFKDGRIRVNAPTIVSMRNSKGEAGPPSNFMIAASGELSIGWDKYLFVNDVINNILLSLEEKSSDDW